MLHEKDGARVHQQWVCEKDGAVVTREQMVKGFELAKNKYVEVDTDELQKLMVEPTHSIDISDFVEQAEIDPVYFHHTYYVAADKGGAKAYTLLHAAMKQSGRIGIARVVMRGKNYLCALRPGDKSLMLTTMQYADEILAAPAGAAAKPSSKELAMANQLIDALSGKFEPTKYQDDYREDLLGLIHKKAKGMPIAPPERAPAVEVTDLMEALSRSLNARTPARKPVARRHRAPPKPVLRRGRARKLRDRHA
jgi:DNA end-binding protein Ku